jgi:hypothetical protein
VLRERFARENKQKKKKSGDAGGVTSVWPYYDLLLFLKDYIKHRNTSGNVGKEPDEDEEQDVAVDSTPATPPMMPASTSTPASNTSAVVTQAQSAPQASGLVPSKIKKKEEVINLDKVLLTEIVNTKEEDEDGYFGASIAASLRKMDPKKKMLARIKIQQAIYDVECGMQSPQPTPPQGQYPPILAPHLASYTFSIQPTCAQQAYPLSVTANMYTLPPFTTLANVSDSPIPLTHTSPMQFEDIIH